MSSVSGAEVKSQQSVASNSSPVPLAPGSAVGLPLDLAPGNDSGCCGGSSSTSCGCASTKPKAQSLQPLTGRTYWRSLEELADTPEFNEFLAREFPTSASEILTSADRRDFLRVMGASLALAGLGLSGCRRWPDEKIAPYAHRPAGRMPGSPVYYATSLELVGLSAGLLVKSYDGRPIKVEGNPDHPGCRIEAGTAEHQLPRGATDLWSQASILDLYDPDRSQKVLNKNSPSTWSAFTAWLTSNMDRLKAANGQGLVVLSEATSSPSVSAMRQQFKAAFPQAEWLEYEALSNHATLNGYMYAYGKPYRPQYAFDKARVVLSLESDYLMEPIAGVSHMRGHAAARRAADAGQGMSRLYVFESGVTVTGANADERVALRSADVAIIAARVAAACNPALQSDLQLLASSGISTSRDDAALNAVVAALLKDLADNRGASIVIAGRNQPAEVHLLAHIINDALGNVGQTVAYSPAPEMLDHLASIRSLCGMMERNEVDTLIMLGGNPAFDAPADLTFADLLPKVPHAVHLSLYANETSAACEWHVNRAHDLESWGDGRGIDGTYTLRQPLIEALFDGKSPAELLAAMLGQHDANAHDIVRRTFDEQLGGNQVDLRWREALHQGVAVGGTWKPEKPTINMGGVSHLLGTFTRLWRAQTPNELEIAFVPAAGILDGRFANNGWLQEMPDPITKLTWDNAAIMNPLAASSRGLKTGDVVLLAVGGREIEIPVLALPGQWTNTITVALGYGRRMPGRICAGAGVDVYPLRTSETMGFAGNASVRPTGRFIAMARTQDHHAIDTIGGRGTQERLPTLFREADFDEYLRNPHFAAHRTHVVHRLSLWEEDHPFQSEEGRKGSQYAWAMAVDLNTCTGCGACIMACQAENNIPIVGKDQVIRGREMHWLRIDRYFKAGTEEQPEAFALMPVMCVHCENAPCEQVCPVAATVHDADGLNVMIYNRCVGTRYCSNNCPYKVRRFNYYDFHRREPHRTQPGMLLQVEPDYYRKPQAHADPLKQMQFNPEVTVRMRGIMEKCTYCIQRVEHARIEAKNAWVQADVGERSPRVAPIADGTIVTACEQACPAQAITFGDLNDPGSRVSRLHEHRRAYQMLEELNTKPRTQYLAKVRNPSVNFSTTGHGHGGAHESGQPAQPHESNGQAGTGGHS